MLYALGNIFSSKPRHAEQTDTRQAIKRHDPDFEREDDEQDREDQGDLQEDSATVSVDALRIFLVNFAREGAENEAQKSKASKMDAPHDLKTQDNAQAAAFENTDTPADNCASPQAAQAAHKAASAYQSVSEVNKKTVLLETTDNVSGPSLDLSAADMRTVYILIEDLKTLSEARIEYLQIERAASFLDSLVAATASAKTALQL